MASFSRSKSNLNLTLPTITGGPGSRATGMNPVSVGALFQANRRGAPDFGSIVAQNSASETNILNAIKDANALALQGGISGYTQGLTAKNAAEAAIAKAKEKAKSSMFGSILGTVATIGGTALAAPLGPFAPAVGAAAGKVASGVGSSVV